ncbi:Dihydroorotate dehydrogenase (quinone)-like 1 [Homarus americanus]|uniref:Dihydroorotate dehydrogenase (Quinone)-like 1 n=1 Tax=Homarus americanus TaxID=6706 RepID=A0A8J5TN86_HOMAM|nr:Dihydroorotate dehydrogenase (quinone)-like 1 [Homarus americanus]
MMGLTSRLFTNKVFKKKITDIFKVAVGGGVVFAGINVYFKNEKFYDTWIMPVFSLLDPETSHTLAVTAAKYNLVSEVKLRESKLLDPPGQSSSLSTPMGITAQESVEV